MPLTKEQRAAYGPEWPAISKRVRAKAENRCEQCKAPNGQMIARGGDVDAGTYMLEDGSVFDENDGTARGCARGSEYDAKRFVKVVLTVAHLGRPAEFPLLLHVTRHADALEVIELVGFIMPSGPEGFKWPSMVHDRASADLNRCPPAFGTSFVVALPSGASCGSPTGSIVRNGSTTPIWVSLTSWRLLCKPRDTASITTEAPSISQMKATDLEITSTGFADAGAEPTLDLAQQSIATGVGARAFVGAGLVDRHLKHPRAKHTGVLAFTASGHAADPRSLAAKMAAPKIVLETFLGASRKLELLCGDSKLNAALDTFVCEPGPSGSRHIAVLYHLRDEYPEHCADENLKALCQQCHLRYDAKHHAKNARRTREARCGQQQLGFKEPRP